MYDLSVYARNGNKELNYHEKIKNAIRLGYSCIALDTRVDVNTVNNRKDKNLKDLFPEPIPINQGDYGGNVRILNRLTVEVDKNFNSNKIMVSNSLKKYDLLAVMPLDLDSVQNALTKLPCDIVYLHHKICRYMYLHVKWYRQAVRRGVTVELQYGPLIADNKALADTISLAYELIRLGNGKNLILCSGGDVESMRSPYDVINLGVMFGQYRNPDDLVKSNCWACLLHAETRCMGRISAVRIVRDKVGTGAEVLAEDQDTSHGNTAKRSKTF